jgi:hypothetical protein
VTPPRPTALIRHELETAIAYQDQAQQRPSSNRLVNLMRAANDTDVTDLENELGMAAAGDLELTLGGVEYESHRVSLRYISKLLDTLQSSFRALYRAITPEENLRRSEAILSLVATQPGSFRVVIAMPTAQLEFLEPPIADKALSVIVDLLASAARGTTANDIPPWIAGTDEAAVRSMIRFSVALAGAKGSVSLRWHENEQDERIVTVTSQEARTLAIALSGETGREILTVTGHLEMAQDQPPRIRIRTSNDDFVASVPSEDLLDQVKGLLFGEVTANLVIDMRTSVTTGSPDTRIELMDIEPA